MMGGVFVRNIEGNRINPCIWWYVYNILLLGEVGGGSKSSDSDSAGKDTEAAREAVRTQVLCG